MLLTRASQAAQSASDLTLIQDPAALVSWGSDYGWVSINLRTLRYRFLVR